MTSAAQIAIADVRSKTTPSHEDGDDPDLPQAIETDEIAADAPITAPKPPVRYSLTPRHGR